MDKRKFTCRSRPHALSGFYYTCFTERGKLVYFRSPAIGYRRRRHAVVISLLDLRPIMSARIYNHKWRVLRAYKRGLLRTELP